MKKFINIVKIWPFVISVMICVSVISIVSVVSAERNAQIVLDFSFEQPTITEDGEVIIQGLPSMGDKGYPVLPVKPISVLIPQGNVLESVGIDLGEQVSLGTNFDVKIGQEVETPSDPQWYQDDEINFNESIPYPTDVLSIIDTYHFRGYSIAMFNLFPVGYIGETGEIFYYQEITITIETIYTGEINPFFRGDPGDELMMQQKVDDYSMSYTYTTLPETTLSTIVDPSDKFEYIIITVDNLIDTSFQDLIESKNAQGITSTIVSVEDIEVCSDYWWNGAFGDGDPFFNDTACHIRNFIKDAYMNWETNYTFLGGDVDFIPARSLWAESGSGGLNIPSDLYYGCLDGSYNFDGDNKWGEPTDGVNGSDVDLSAEVYIGRACVDNDIDVSNIVSKTLAYENTQSNYLENVLFAGEFLGFGGPAEYGGNHKDEMIDGSNVHGYSTIGVPSNSYNISTLYDRDGTWPVSDIMNQINNGVHFINHLGHANYVSNMKIFLPNVYNLINNEYCFIYSQGCNAGGFDQDDCIAEHFTVKTENGAFAGIWNARSGWGRLGSTDGPSQRFDREFWDAIFGESLDIPKMKELGVANQDSKEDNLYRIDQTCMRWCYYELNLLGDPIIRIKSPYEHNIGVQTVAVDPPGHIKPNETVFVNSTLINNGRYNETDVIVSFQVDGLEVDNIVISFFERETSQHISFNWTTYVGLHTLTINVTTPNIIEDNYIDNEKSDNIMVGILNNDTGNLFETIQDAIDDPDTFNGHTLIVPNGIYQENIVINKGIYLIGKNQDTTIIEGEETALNVVQIINTDSVKITKFSIKNGAHGIFISSSINTIISNNNISDNICGVHIINSSSNNIIMENEILNNGEGIKIDITSYDNLVYNNNLDNSLNAFDAGNNNKWDNGYLLDESGLYLCGGNWWSDYNGSDELKGINQNESDPDGIGDTPYNISGGSNSQDNYPLIKPWPEMLPLAHIYIDDNNTNGPWYGTIKYPYHNIQNGINASDNGNTIFVYSGIYYENLFINKTILIWGEDKNNTVIDGRLNENTVFISADEVRISGFTIQKSGYGEQCIDMNIETSVGDPNNVIDDINYRCISISIDINENAQHNAGIYLNANNSCIYGNKILNNYYGLYINDLLTYNNISSNCFIGNRYNIWVQNSFYNNFSENIIEQSFIALILKNSSQNMVYKNNFDLNNLFTIVLEKSYDNIISGNTIGELVMNLGSNILINYGHNNTVTKNVINTSKGWSGIIISKSSNNDIYENIIIDNSGDGIDVVNSSNNSFVNNLLNNGINGIDIKAGSNNNYVLNNTFKSNGGCAIMLWNMGSLPSNHNSILNNNFLNNGFGIFIDESAYDTILNNSFLSDEIVFWGYSISYWNTHIIEDNYVNGKPIYYYKNNHIGETITSDVAQVILANCSNFTIRNINFIELGSSIQLGFSQYNTISENQVINNFGVGLQLRFSSNNFIVNNTISNCSTGIGYGIYLINSYYNLLIGNRITNNSKCGILLHSSSFNNFTRNVIDGNKRRGIMLSDVGTILTNNTINENVIMNNGYGIYLYAGIFNTTIINNNITNNFYGFYASAICSEGYRNIIYHNNFANVYKNAYDERINTWYNSYHNSGNYWDDYSGIDINGDGIGDTSYNIPGGNNEDKYPLMNPWKPPKNIHVDDDNIEGPWDGTINHPYQYIQDGINNGSLGDTVYVYNGTYYENLILNKSIILIGENSDSTIIDGRGSGDVLYIPVAGASISGFKIQNSGNNSDDAGIDISQIFTTISENLVINNYCGISIHEDADQITIVDNTIINNLDNGIHTYYSNNNNIRNNDISYNKNGIYLDTSVDSNIFNNTITNNNNNGIKIWYGDSNKIQENNLQTNNENSIEIKYSDNNTIFYNYIQNNNDSGIKISWYSYYNNITKNVIMDNNGYGLTIDHYTSDNNQIYHNNFINNNQNAYDDGGDNIWDNNYPSGGNFWDDYTGEDNNHDGIGDTPYDIPLSSWDEYPLMNPWSAPGSTTYYVDDDNIAGPWLGIIEYPFQSIFDAIEAAEYTGDKIYVFNGFYNENLDIFKSVEIFGENREQTIIDSQGDTALDLYADMINISGFTIQNGGFWNNPGIAVRSDHNTIIGNKFQENWNSLSCLDYASNNIITNNIFTNNQQVIYLENSNNNIISENDIFENTYKGIELKDSTNNIITENSIESNNEGIILDDITSNNQIYQNNLINYDQNAQDMGINHWNSTNQGNYWSNYDEPSEGAYDDNKDGIVDNPYNIPGGSNQDQYPLMTQYGPPHADFTHSANDKTIFFDASISYDYDGTIVLYEWNFGDNNYGFGMITSHYYTNYDVYDVFLTVTDDEGKENTVLISVPVEDFIIPEITDNSPTSAYTGDQYIFNATVTDNHQVLTVTVEYWFGNGEHTNASMLNTYEDYWQYSIYIPHTLETLNYKITARDEFNNSDSTDIQYVTVEDNDPPTLSNDNTPSTGTTGDPVAFQVEADDNIGIAHVYVYWKKEQSSVYMQQQMNHLSGSTYNWTEIVDLNDDDNLNYYFEVEDEVPLNNYMYSSENPAIIIITDNDTPTLSNDNTPTTCTTGEDITFQVNADDNIDVDYVYVYWRKAGDPTYTQQVMTNGDTYSYSMTIDSIDDTDIEYYFEALDPTSNIGTMYSSNNPAIVTILDNDLPEISDISANPPSTTIGEHVNISCIVTDNINVEIVRVNISGPDGFDTVNITMNSGDDNRYYYNQTYNIAAIYEYYIWAKDTSGNEHISDTNTFDVAILIKFIRGDADNDSEITMGDAISILQYLYVPGSTTPTCLDAADSNDNGEISMSDAIFIMKYLYVPDSPETPPPGPHECGVDPTEDELDCICHSCFC